MMDYNCGDEIEVVVDREGLAQDVGVGHLPDDTMVVLVGAGARVGECVQATIVGIEKLRLGSSVLANVKL
ncbi:MAG: hypothetical protein NT018_06465 [Armatimonadetes bacterium]|nr:hypothetical protein [Armatimonadota bacterium]